MSRIQICKLVLALSAAAAVLILHGFSFFVAAVFFYAAGAAFVRGQQAVTSITVLLGGLSVISCGNLGYALIAVGAILAISFSNSAVSRYLFLLSMAAIFLSGAVEGTAPILAAALAASMLKKELTRLTILATGISAVLIISGLPQPHEYPSTVSEELLTDNGVVWPWMSELNLSMPELLMQDPRKEIASVTLHVSAGGVRDSKPVGLVISADRTFPIYSGEDVILIEEPGFPISIRISRQWQPFTHPVIHVHSAEASL